MPGSGRARSSDHFQTTQPVTGTGLVGVPPNNNNPVAQFDGQYLVKGEGTIRLDTTGADAGVVINIEVRIGKGAWTALATHTGALVEDYNVLSWDYVRFDVTTFAGPEFTFRASGFFYVNPADVNYDVSVVPGTSGPILITGATVAASSLPYPAVNQAGRASLSIRNIGAASIYIVNSSGLTFAAADPNVWEIPAGETYNVDLDDTSQVYLVTSAGTVDIQIQEIKG